MGEGCSCKLDVQKTPAVFGWVVIYELAIIIMILLFIYMDLDNTNETGNVDTAKKAAEETSAQ